MDWLRSISEAIRFMEANLENKIDMEDVAGSVFSSSSHFQRLFTIITGITAGEYLRNRRLSQAGHDLSNGKLKVIEAAMKYQYDTSESFSKAFSRFHGISPSEAKTRGYMLKCFKPLTISITIQGGYDMSHKLIDEFYWNHTLDSRRLTDTEKYKELVGWALKARGHNPEVFDSLTEWIANDAEWSTARLEENEQILMNGVLARFKEQNARLREYLKRLEPAGVVNKAVFGALDAFDEELSGRTRDANLTEVVKRVFDDFSAMLDPSVRKLIAGCVTGPTGTNGVELFGYINHLKECDASVQWTLFMPDVVRQQQKGFQAASFEYMRMSAMRFIGFEGEEYADPEKRMAKMKALDLLEAYQTALKYDTLLMHFGGDAVDIGRWHGVWGRFMKAETPVPEGYLAIDFAVDDDGLSGQPFLSRFAYAAFTGDTEAMHSREGFDADAMYDVTRNIILGQGGKIPYPSKYWTAEVFPEGCTKPSTAYMFSAEI